MSCFCVKAGLKNRIQRDCSRETEREDLNDTGKVPYLDCGDYGWEGEVKKQDCENWRAGKALLPPHGNPSFPGVCLICFRSARRKLSCVRRSIRFCLDFETLPGYAGAADGETVDKQISNYINSSVLKTGILPELIWGGERSNCKCT